MTKLRPNFWQYLLVLILFSQACSTGRPAILKHDAMQALMKKNAVPAVGVCIIEKGKVASVHVYGELPDHSPAPENTLFNIASLTKPLVSALVLKLVDQGQWQLDEPLFHYWTDPDVATDPRNQKLTTRHVLSHQSGLPNWRGHEPGGKLSFAFEPGTQWKYSGEGFEYLRQAIEHKFHTSIAQLADSLVFKPFGMTDTRFWWDRTMDSTRYANRYHADGTPFDLEKWYAPNASNLVLTTVGDYGRFGVAVLRGMGLSATLQQEMIRTQAVPGAGKEFGLSWRVVRHLRHGEYALMHTGSNPGLHTVILLLPKSKRGLVVFTNGENGRAVYEEVIAQSLDVGKELLDRMK